MIKSEYSIISFDMYQTLVDITPQIPIIWKEILKNTYTEEKKDECYKFFSKVFTPIYKEQTKKKEFVSIASMYEQFANQVIPAICLDLEPYKSIVTKQKIITTLLTQHGCCPFYDDVIPSLLQLQKKYTLILSSDADTVMILPIIEKLKKAGVDFKYQFISEQIKSYKDDPWNRFFSHVITTTKVINPQKILHVGDSKFDINGANNSGIPSCQIIRNSKPAQLEQEPNIVVHSLTELCNIL